MCQKIVLNLGQIERLAEFAKAEGSLEFTICHAFIPEQDEVPEYDGLIAYSDKEHGVLELGE